MYEPREDTYLLEDVIRNHTLSPGVVVEVGCGPGYLLRLLAEKTDEVVGVDLQLQALQEAARRIEGDKPRVHLIQASLLTCFRPNSRVSLVVTNPPYLPTDSEFFDETIHGGPTGVEVVSSIVEEACRIMKKGCRVIAVVSSLSDLRKLEDHARRLGLRITRLASRRFFFEELTCLEISEETP